jgi:hypothetical protein
MRPRLHRAAHLDRYEKGTRTRLSSCSCFQGSGARRARRLIVVNFNPMIKARLVTIGTFSMLVWLGGTGCSRSLESAVDSGVDHGSVGNPDACAMTCPATPPTIGAPCSGIPVGGCEYGDDPWYGCDTDVFCDPQARWSMVPINNQAGSSCPTILPSACPSSFIAASSGGQNGCPSASTNLICPYPEGTCSCAPGGTFSCPPTAPVGCPAARPRVGTPCSGACTSWGSGLCDGESLICACGVWQLVVC